MNKPFKPLRIPKTAQGVFNAVVRHLRKQGARSFDSTKGQCMYRGPGGLKCAIGPFLPNYNPRMEGKGLRGLFADFPNETAAFSDHEYLWMQLQSAHDSSEPESWEPQFKAIAGRFNLVYTAP